MVGKFSNCLTTSSQSIPALATQFAETTGRKYAGRQTQKSGTLGVDQTAEKGLAIVKELNAIVTKKLRPTDPVLLGVWKAASRLEQPPQHALRVLRDSIKIR
jgi:hypothetical protein